MSKIKTGFIGVGSQGGPMAERLLEAGYPLTVWARRTDALEQFRRKGAAVAASVAELGAACDHVGLCVVNDADVAEICAQLVPAMRRGSLLAIHSTILPESCERLEADCAARGILFLDAPVSGGGHAAAAGVLTVMCGGRPEAFDQARPVLESFGKHIVHLGGAGAGQRAKIVNNALLAANMGLAQAACAAAERLGVERAAFADLIKESSGRSYGFEVYARLPSPGAFAQGAALLVKDVDLLAAVLGPDENGDLLQQSARFFLAPATDG